MYRINEAVMSWVRPAALIYVLGIAGYMEIRQLKVSEFFIGIVTTVIIWFFKSRDESKKET